METQVLAVVSLHTIYLLVNVGPGAGVLSICDDDCRLSVENEALDN